MWPTKDSLNKGKETPIPYKQIIIENNNKRN